MRGKEPNTLRAGQQSSRPSRMQTMGKLEDNNMQEMGVPVHMRHLAKH